MRLCFVWIERPQRNKHATAITSPCRVPAALSSCPRHAHLRHVKLYPYCCNRNVRRKYFACFLRFAYIYATIVL